jgi:hypothetical protein
VRRRLCELALADAVLAVRRAELLRQVADIDDVRDAHAVQRAALQREARGGAQASWIKNEVSEPAV